MQVLANTYKTVAKPSEGIFKDRGSKFIAYLFPVQTEEEVKSQLVKIKKEHHSANHHCYAYQIGIGQIFQKSADDGEPYGTAGKPILNQILSHNLTNVLIIVVRYFGGTLLGTNGLINAYKQASIAAIRNTDIVTKAIECSYKIDCEYYVINEVMNIIKQTEAVIVKQNYDALFCELFITMAIAKEKLFTDKIEQIRIHFPSLSCVKL